MNLENLIYMAFAICTDNQLSILSRGLFLDVWADRTAQDHCGAGLEQHHGADSGSTVLSEVGRHVAGGTLFLWENESRGISFSIILMSNMDTEKSQ